MTPSFFEIVQLSDGDYALRRVDDESAPLVRITFSEEAREMMENEDINVAKAMIAAGIEAAGHMGEGFELEDEEPEPQEPRPSYTIH